ncbi:MAG: hypothetical protein BGO28_01085 [Alphaproteobacteria bacterium 43-37]|nr:MAG: hypothetical protein BGO28_01085 [Alphaproteobacteria bacterium 43-37]
MALSFPSNLDASIVREPSTVCVALVKNYEKAHPSQTVKNCPLASQVLDWLKIKDGIYTETFHDAVALLHQLNWPEQNTLIEKVEGLLSANTSPHDVMSWFKNHSPLTGGGAYYYLLAHTQLHNDPQSIKKLARKFWLSLNFNEQDEKLFLGAFGQYLTAEDHWKRTERLLWDERVDAALRMIKKLPSDKTALAHARIQLIRDVPGVEGTIARIPSRLKNDEGLWYNRTKWRRLRHLENAGDFLYSNPKLSSFWNSYWAKERLVLARDLIRQHDFQHAYTIASHHGTNEGVDFAEAEWLSGWLALKFLNKPQAAYKHFQHLYANVVTPMSKGKAAYWCAQAAQQLHATKDYHYWLQIAAKHPAHFYGQLAYAALHNNQFPNPHYLPSLPSNEVGQFSSRKEAQTLALLYRANLEKHFKGFLEHLAESLSSHERRLLLNYLQHLAPRYVVFTARKMARFDNMLIKEAFPTDQNLIKSLGRDVDPALVHAIIRQESSFDPYATSPAGAMGLMQLMSGTAKEIAKKLGLKFNKKHLHTQPSFNVRLGQHYLKELLGRFDQSVPITLAAYNAGPGNARKWLTEVGDPRTGEMDAIDWIEALPFGQTRDYVLRVMENYNIYSQLLRPKHSHSAHKP